MEAHQSQLTEFTVMEAQVELVSLRLYRILLAL